MKNKIKATLASSLVLASAFSGVATLNAAKSIKTFSIAVNSKVTFKGSLSHAKGSHHVKHVNHLSAGTVKVLKSGKTYKVTGLKADKGYKVSSVKVSKDSKGNVKVSVKITELPVSQTFWLSKEESKNKLTYWGTSSFKIKDDSDRHVTNGKFFYDKHVKTLKVQGVQIDKAPKNYFKLEQDRDLTKNYFLDSNGKKYTGEFYIAKVVTSDTNDHVYAFKDIKGAVSFAKWFGKPVQDFNTGLTSYNKNVTSFDTKLHNQYKEEGLKLIEQTKALNNPLYTDEVYKNAKSQFLDRIDAYTELPWESRNAFASWKVDNQPTKVFADLEYQAKMESSSN